MLFKTTLSKLYIFILLAFATPLMASELEIQCQTSSETYDFVLKRSPDSQVSYALLFTSEQLETYIALKDNFIVIENSSEFHYQDSERGHNISVNLVTGDGHFHLPWSQLESEQVVIFGCQSTVN